MKSHYPKHKLLVNCLLICCLALLGNCSSLSALPAPSCGTSFDVSPTSCGASDGVVKVYVSDVGTTHLYILKKINGPIYIDSTNDIAVWDGLAAGAYVLIVTGPEDCEDTIELTIPEDCAPPCETFGNVCGSDGITYETACYAEEAGVSWTPGPCNPPIYELPAWMQNLISNSSLCNQCVSSLNLLSYQGAYFVHRVGAECNNYFSRIYKLDNGLPVCNQGGNPGFTACNTILQQAAFVETIWDSSQCASCICPIQYDPVCAENGLTYDNACFAECEGLSWQPGACPLPCEAEAGDVTNQSTIICQDSGGFNLQVSGHNTSAGYAYAAFIASGDDIVTTIFSQSYAVDASYIDDGDCVYGLSYLLNDPPNFFASTISELLAGPGCFDLTDNCTSITDLGYVTLTPVADPTCVPGGYMEICAYATGGSGQYILDTDYQGNLVMSSSGQTVCWTVEAPSKYVVALDAVTLCNYGPGVYFDAFDCPSLCAIDDGLIHCTGPMQSYIFCPEFCQSDYTLTSVSTTFGSTVTLLAGTPCVQVTPLPGFLGQETVIFTACNTAGFCESTTKTLFVDLNCNLLDTFTTEPSYDDHRKQGNASIEWTIYPNPTEGIIQLSHLAKEPLSLQLYNANGQLVLAQDLHTDSAQKLELNLSQLPKGIYLLRLSGAQFTETKRLFLR